LSEKFHLLQRKHGNLKRRRLRIIKVPNYQQTITEHTRDISV
jgi:hypothetical protein